MQLAYRLVPDFPVLAWIALGRRGDDLLRVLHGRHVETQSRLFVEGAWAGDFPAEGIDGCDTVFGTGGVVREDAVTFVSSTATTDFLYYREDGTDLAVANSLPLLLAAVDDELLPACADYSRINMSVLGGIHSYLTEIPTRRGAVRRIMHRNLRFDRAGVAVVEKPLPPDPPDYGSYVELLRDRIGKVFANARHPARRQPLRIYSTQSRGYDSTAVNALVAPLGLDAVFTSPESKEKGSFYMGGRSDTPSDDGTAICGVLGLHCVRIDRRSFEKESFADERYYWAALDNNLDLNLHEITEHLHPPALLLTGQYGEFWYTRECTGPHRMHFFDDGLGKWDQAGHGQSEVRLRAGFVQAPIPVIGQRRRASLLGITECAEMAPWRLGSSYDRPIPRRIAEERGVAREMFGHVKLASVVHLPTPNVPVTAGLRAEFFRHLRRQRLLGWAGIRLLPGIQRLNNWIRWRCPDDLFSQGEKHPWLWYAGRVWARLFGHPPRIAPQMIWTRIDSYLYAFCVNKVRGEYVASLAAAAPAAPGNPADAQPIGTARA